MQRRFCEGEKHGHLFSKNPKEHVVLVLDETCMMLVSFLLGGAEDNFLGRCRKITQVFPVNLTHGKPQLLLSYLEFRTLIT